MSAADSTTTTCTWDMCIGDFCFSIGTNGLGLALIGVSAAAFGWLFKEVWEYAFGYYLWRKKRKNALIYLMVDILMAKDKLNILYNESTRERVLENITTNEHYRPYVEDYFHFHPEGIDKYIASLSPREVVLIRNFQIDFGLLRVSIRNLSSDKFYNLTPKQKKQIVESHFAFSVGMNSCCDQLKDALLDKHGFLNSVVCNYNQSSWNYFDETSQREETK